MRARSGCLIVVALAIAATASSLPTTSNAQTDEPLVYRRVFVPADSLDSQIRDLLPLKREEFERRLNGVQRQTNSLATQTLVRIEQATFRTRLDANQLAGDASLAVVTSGNAAALLPLQPCSFTIESATWSAGDSRNAIFGADQNGKLQCLVDHSGDLSLKWRQAATNSSTSQRTFDLQFPSSPSRRLEINAPAGLELTIDSGLIVANQPSPDEPDRRIWKMELTGDSNVRLNVHSDRHKPNPAPRIVARDSTVYSVLPAAVDFETTLKLDVLDQPTDQLSFTTTQPVSVLGVQVDGQNASFQITATGKGLVEHRLELATPLAGADHSLTISGTAQRSVGGPWILPRILLSDVQIQEGAAQIVSPTWMKLSARGVSGCIQTGVTGAGPGRNLDRYDFQLFSPTAAIEIVPSQALPPLVEDSGTQISVEASQVTGVYVAELTSAAANRFGVEAQISRQWIVDAVETHPPEMLADRALTSGKDGIQRLQFQLAHPISNLRPLRVVIRAHYRRPANNETLDPSFFQLARFPEARGGRQLVSVQVHDPSAQLVLLDADRPRELSAEQLSVRERSLFEEQPHGLVLESGAALANSRAQLVPATAQYHADILVRADVNRHNVVQRASIRCQPEASAVASVLVGLTPAPNGEVTWRLGGEMPRELPAVLEGRPVAGSASEQFFRVLLPRIQTSPFELIGEWSHTLSSSSELALVALPEATRQQGLLEVHSPSNRMVIRATDMQPLPFAPLDPHDSTGSDQEAPLRGRYRYDSGGRGRATIQVAATENDSLGTWIETLQLRSYFSIDGTGEHEARLVAHGGGESSLQLLLPPRATGFRLVNNDGTEERLETVGADHSLRVPLSLTQERSELLIRYTSGPTIAEMWPLARLIAPVPQPNAVVLAQSWEVFIPRQLVVMRTKAERQPASFPSLPTPAANPKSLREYLQTQLHLLAGVSGLARLVNGRETSTSDDESFVGWTVVRSDLKPEPEASLRVYRADSISAWYWSLVLLGVALVGWLRQWVRWIPAVVAFMAMLAILLEVPWSSLAAGLATGFAAGGIGLLIGKRSTTDRPWLAQLKPVAQTLSVPVGTGAAVLLACGLSYVCAAPPAESPAAPRRPKVIFPVDSNQQPTGDYVYVDEQLYQRLHQSAERGPAGLPAWLLEGANYVLPDAPKIHGDAAAVDELRAVFDFSTFHAATTIHLPMRREQVLLLEGRARLDGLPATLTWRADGGELSLNVPEAGKHRLELALGATARKADDGMHVVMAIPIAAHSAVTLPPGAELRDSAGIRLAAAAGQGIPLSPGTELHVFWPTGNLGIAGKAVLEAEQYSLWRVHSGSVVLESQFRLKPTGGAVREVVVEADPRLRPLPNQGTSASNRTTFEHGSPSLLRIELPESVTAETNLRLAWLWPDVSGLGQFELPSVHLRADRLTRHWTAVTLEPGITLDRPPVRTATPTMQDFVAAVGEIDSEPVVAAWDSTPDRPIVIATKPVVALPQAEESIDWSISAQRASAMGIIRLTDVASSRFEHRFHVPPKLQVKQVSLTQRGKTAAIRWEQQGGDLTVSLLEPPEPEQTLALQAELPLESGNTPFHIPQIVLRDLKRRETNIGVYRQPHVQLTVKATEDWQQLPEPIGSYQSEKGRLVAALRGDVATAPPILVSIAPNQPRITGKMLIRVAQADGDWTAEVEAQLQIAGGVMDELRLTLPAPWADRLIPLADVEQSLEGAAGEARRRLVLRPRAAATGAWQVRLRGPLLSGPDGLRTPDVAMEGNPQIQRFVMLDAGAGMGQLEWITTGLVALDEAAQAGVPAAWRGLSGNLFQVIGSRFEAMAHTKHDGNQIAQIHLADLRAALHGNRRLAVTADLTILPAAGSDVEFSLPPGCRLLQTLVDGIAVPHSSLGLRSWKLALPSDVLPFRLTIVYDLPLPAGNQSEVVLPLATPQVNSSSMQHALWSFELDDRAGSHDRRYHLAAALSDGKQLVASSRAEADLIRLQSLTKTIEDLAASQADRIPASVLAETFARWDQRFADTQQRIQRAAIQPSSKDITDNVRTCVETVAKIRQRLEQAEILPADSGTAKTTPLLSSEGSDSSTPFILEDEQTELTIVLSRSASSVHSTRLFQAAVMAILTIILAAAPNFTISRSWLLAHAHFALGAAGFAWWLLAPLGWLGLLLILVAGWLALRSPWPAGKQAS